MIALIADIDAVSFGKVLYNLRRIKRLSQERLAAAANVSSQTISNIETGVVAAPQDETYTKIARALGMEPEQLDEMWKGGGMSDPNKVRDLPLAAGPWTMIDDLGDGIPSDDERASFRVRLRGDSMTPIYPDGQIVEFECLRDGLHKLIAGKDYYIQRGEDATFKRLEKFDEEQLTFRALNRQKYPSAIIVPRVEIVRMAVALNKVEPV